MLVLAIHFFFVCAFKRNVSTILLAINVNSARKDFEATQLKEHQLIVCSRYESYIFMIINICRLYSLNCPPFLPAKIVGKRGRKLSEKRRYIDIRVYSRILTEIK